MASKKIGKRVGEPTPKQILSAIVSLGQKNDKQFDGVNKQFDGVYKQFDGMYKALADLSQATGDGFEKVYREFSGVNERLDRIEAILLQDHERRLEALERKVFSRS